MGKTFKRIIRGLLEGLIEVVYPRENYCIICKNDNCVGICNTCKKSIKKIDNKYQDEVISYGYYGGVLKDLILKFKYKNNFTAEDILEEFLEEYIINNFKNEEYHIYLYQKNLKKSEDLISVNI